MTRPILLLLALSAGPGPLAADPATAQARQVCLSVTMSGPDAWGSVTCVPIDRPRDRPRDRPARLRR